MSRTTQAQLGRETIHCSDCEQGMPHFVPPDLDRDHFTCPNCGDHSWQSHFDLYGMPPDSPLGRPDTTCQVTGFAATQCDQCGQYALWHDAEAGRPIYPNRTLLPAPATGMPEHLVREYEEARSIYAGSARACIALLGLVLESMWREAERSEPDARAALRELDQHGHVSVSRLPYAVAVQPGVIRRREQDGDDPHTAQVLCRMINELVEKISSLQEMQANQE